jgi:hypothetical protein
MNGKELTERGRNDKVAELQKTGQEEKWTTGKNLKQYKRQAGYR